MPTLVQDQELERMIIEDRRRRGVDGPDEVWDGVYLKQRSEAAFGRLSRPGVR